MPRGFSHRTFLPGGDDWQVYERFKQHFTNLAGEFKTMDWKSFMMNPDLFEVLEWLSGGDIRSDGLSSDVASLVLKNEQLYNELLEGICVEDDLIRGRAADALEKIARSRPDLLVDDLALFIKVGQEDPVPMVRWHIAMIFGHLAPYEELTGQLTRTLLDYLQDTSVFVKSWSIVSLCIIGRMYSSENRRMIEAIIPLERDSSVAIRTKVKKAIPLLMNDRMPFPKGWIKSERVELLVMSTTSA